MNVISDLRPLFAGMMVCLCFLTVSCRNNSIDEPYGERPEQGGTAFFSINVCGTAGVSATRSLETEIGVANESRVNRVLLVLYDVDTGDVEYQFPVSASSDGASAVSGSDIYKSGTSKEFQTVAKAIVRKDYDLLVVVNPREVIKAATAVGENISRFKTAVTVSDVTKLTGVNYDDFVMCNWQDLVFVDAGTYLFSSEEEALDNPVPVYVERAVGKVLVESPAKKDKTFTLEGWVLDVVNKKTYWMRQPWMALNSNGTGVTNEKESPNPAERYLNYAKDPNAARDQYTGNAWHSYQAWLAHDRTGAAPDSLNKDFAFISSASVSWNTPGVNNWRYVTENTMEASQQYEDVATSVILKAKYHPVESALGATIETTKPYFVFYKGESRYLFTAEELDAEYTYQEKNGGKPQTYTVPQIQEFMNHIGQYRGLLGENTSFTAFATVSTQASCNLQNDFSYFDSKHTNYYRIPVPHFSEAEQPDPMGYGRYGVVRNNVYKLTVDDIYGPGKAEIIPKGIDPNNPDDPDDPDDPEVPEVPQKDMYWLSYHVKILDWTIRESGVSAGDED